MVVFGVLIYCQLRHVCSVVLCPSWREGMGHVMFPRAQWHTKVVVGGVGGRRLSEGSSVGGFFSHIETMAEEGSWRCTDVPLPQMPKTYTRREHSYLPCTDGQPNRKSPCESLYGGHIPGAAPLAERHAMATVGKASYFKILAGHEVDVRKKLFAQTKTLSMASESWEVQLDSYMNHPGQQKVYVYNKKTKAGTTFQRIVGGNATHRNERPFCTVVPKNENAMAKWSDIEEDPEKDSNMHFEFLDIVEEEGIFFRHFRMMSSDQLMSWSQANMSKAGAAKGDFEYWDNAETLAPYRLLTPDGMMILLDSVEEGTSDADVEALFGDWGLTPSDATSCPTDAPMDRNEEAPEMLSPALDTTVSDLLWYEIHAYGLSADHTRGNACDTC